jgi:APA family basic amino acid/polyamine antiporter
MTAPLAQRQKSGLVRGFRTIDVFVFNVFGYSLGLALTTNPVFIGGFAPRSNIYLVLAFGLLASVFSGFTYGTFASAMPRSGGDYVYVSRTLAPSFGFLASWGFTIGQILGLAIDVTFAVTWALAPSAVTYGVMTGNARLAAFGAAISNPAPAFAVTLGYLVVLFLMALPGVKFTNRVFVVLFVVGVFGTLLQGYAFFSTSHTDFVAIFNRFMEGQTGLRDAYAVITRMGATPPVGAKQVLWQSIKAMPLGFLVFLGFTYSVYVGSEVVTAKRSQNIGIYGALVFGAVIFFLFMGRYMAVVGADFNAALGSQNVLNQVKFPAGTSMTFFAGLLLRNKALNLLMNVGNLVWFALVPLVILQVCSRNIHVWTLDLLFPAAAAKTTKGGFPYIAGLFVLVGAAICATITYYENIPLVGAIALISIAYVLVGLSAIVFPSTRPHDFKMAPDIARKLWGGVPAISLFGWGTSALFMWIVLASLYFPQIFGTEDRRALVWVVIVYGVGIVYYLWRRTWLQNKLRKEGLTLGDIWNVLPPE